MPPFLILVVLVGTAMAWQEPQPDIRETCFADGKERNENEEWTTPSGFVKKCLVFKTNTESSVVPPHKIVQIIACKSILGVNIKVGSSIVEEGYKITCRHAEKGDSVFKDFEPEFPCVGKYNVGEKWVEKKFFQYECKKEGPVLVSCLSEDGKKAIALGSSEVYEKIKYSCIEKNGSIFINREYQLPEKAN